VFAGRDWGQAGNILKAAEIFSDSPLTPLADNDTIWSFPPYGGVLFGKLELVSYPEDIRGWSDE
jgi:hypothetical protein